MKKNVRKLSSQESFYSASTDFDTALNKTMQNMHRSSTLPLTDLSNARIIQSKLVYIINLPESAASEALLSNNEYFGQYGKILKCKVAKSSQHIAYQAYITYSTDEQAAVCIKACNKFVLDGNELTLTFGTTKYCNYFLRGNLCPKPDCLYLHEFAIENNIVLRDIIPHTKHIQPCNSIFDSLKLVISPPKNGQKLPFAKIVRDRALSQNIFENKGKFGFLEDGDETEVPSHINQLRKLSSPKDEVAEMPLIQYESMMNSFSLDYWLTDVLEFKLQQEKVFLCSKT